MGLKQKKIGVLMGGLSREREISLKSGHAVASALRNCGYEVVEIDAGRDVALKLTEAKIELAVVMLHGRWGEDGTIQGMLEILGIPYTGSSPLASAICINKDFTKQLVREAGVRTPDWKVVRRSDIETLRESPLPLPLIVKPNREGSTLGVSIVRTAVDFRAALQEAGRYDDVILVEQYIQGREVTVGILEGRALPVLEIVPKSGFYDFTSKYTKGMTEYIVPAPIPTEKAEELVRLSEKIFRLLGCGGMARADFILADSPYFLEINTIPGMTETSLVPKAAAAAGISFEEFSEKIIQGASLKT